VRIEADLSRCQMNAVCVVIAPDVFDVDDDDGVRILQQEPAPDQQENAIEAVANCPVQALKIVGS
jgi:ferredoxin